jgi:hypothetical protein
MRLAADRRTGASGQTEPRYQGRLDVCRTAVRPAVCQIYRTTDVHARRICRPRGFTSIRRERTHLCRICGHACRAQNRRERTQSPYVPDSRGRRSRDSHKCSARTKPKSVCGGFAGRRAGVGTGANEAISKEPLRTGQQSRTMLKRAERTQSPPVTDLRAHGSQPKSARTNPKSTCGGFAATRLAAEIGANEAISG